MSLQLSFEGGRRAFVSFSNPMIGISRNFCPSQDDLLLGKRLGILLFLSGGSINNML